MTMITDEIKAKAKDFALSSLQEQIESIEEAYLKGYEEAMKNMPHEPIEDGADHFEDLWLESGTMWSTDVHRTKDGTQPEKLNYYKALEYGLPTKEQYLELFDDIRIDDKNSFVWRSGNGIAIKSPHKELPGIEYTWVKTEDIIDNEAWAVKWESNSHEFVRRFTGYDAKFYCVKDKND